MIPMMALAARRRAGRAAATRKMRTTRAERVLGGGGGGGGGILATLVTVSFAREPTGHEIHAHIVLCDEVNVDVAMEDLMQLFVCVCVCVFVYDELVVLES